MIRLAALLASILMLGFMLRIGKPVLVPILAAVMVVYLLSAAARGMERVPLLGATPEWMRRVFALLTFTVALAALGLLIADQLTRAAAALPRYEGNLERLISRLAAMAGFQDEPAWGLLREWTVDQIDARAFATQVLASVSGLGGSIFLIVLFASFIMVERGTLPGKIARAARDQVAAERLLTVLDRINDRIGRYLVVKTFVNVVLGGISWVVLIGMGVEFAGLWAVLIAVLNYIPYIGSILGVAFPTMAALAQFGTFTGPAVLCAGLTAAQIVVGAALEPPLMGRAFNLSPLVVVVALVIWGLLWGLPGAVLAVPMTASLVIILAEFPASRPVAIMLSAKGTV